MNSVMEQSATQRTLTEQSKTSGVSSQKDRPSISSSPESIATPPSSQQNPSYSEAGQPLSRQSTVSSLMKSSISSFSSDTFGEAGQPLSRQSTASSLVTSSISSFSSDRFEDEGNSENAKLCRILSVVQDIVDQCRICWVNRHTSRPHSTFRCSTRICSGREWQAFKSNIQFPRGIVCYFCFATFGPPFNHALPPSPPGTSQSQSCEYPDVLKELVYIVYQNPALRQKVFEKIGCSEPSNLSMYKRYISKLQQGILGLYGVVCAYLDVRAEEDFLS